MSARPRIVVGISGASGAAIAVRIVTLLHESRACEVHVVISQAARRTLAHEVGRGAFDHLRCLADTFHPVTDVGASIASGSFRTAGMIIAPCSIRTLGALAAVNLDNLLLRAADVHLKERRKLVLLLRESPLHLGHIRAMASLAESGAIIAPPVPAFYHRPASLDAVIDQIARRAIALTGINLPDLAPLEWCGEADTSYPDIVG